MLTLYHFRCPLYLPVTGDNVGNMNWAVAIVGAEVLWSGAYWIYAARHKYMKESSGLEIIEGSVQVLDGQVLKAAHPSSTEDDKGERTSDRKLRGELGE